MLQRGISVIKRCSLGMCTFLRSQKMLIWMALVASHMFVCFIGMFVGAISEAHNVYHNRFKRESIPLQRALEASGLNLPIIESKNGQPYLEGTVTNAEYQVLIQNVRKEIADTMVNRAMVGVRN